MSENFRGAEGSPGQVVFRIRLFFCSYSTLFALLAIRIEVPWIEATLASLTLWGFIDAARISFWTKRDLNSYTYRVDKVEDAGGMITGFLASNLLPFLAQGKPTERDLIAYVVFLLVLLVVSINSDLAHVNPALYLMGRRVVRITSGGDSRILVCRQAPKRGTTIRAVRVGGGLIQV
jgi:hypothetical protein